MICRKVEDFDGLENGSGLKIFIDKNDKTISVGIPWGQNIINRLALSKMSTKTLELIKCMGFQFEWKPKRSLEEVLNDYKEINFIVGQDNCAVYEDVRNGWFSVRIYRGYKAVGTKYYLKKDADKICEELNS